MMHVLSSQLFLHCLASLLHFLLHFFLLEPALSHISVHWVWVASQASSHAHLRSVSRHGGEVGGCDGEGDGGGSGGDGGGVGIGGIG
eukprot:scaffold126273_cov33-Phaeocystis_antarctica.AAC.1